MISAGIFCVLFICVEKGLSRIAPDIYFFSGLHHLVTSSMLIIS